MNLVDFFSIVINQNTLGAIILAAFFTVLGIILKGVLSNHGTITVARINSETSLGTKAIETLTTALEVLQEENKSLKKNVERLEGHMEVLIDHLITIVRAGNQEELDKSVHELQQFLKAIGRWPY